MQDALYADGCDEDRRFILDAEDRGLADAGVGDARIIVCAMGCV